jgi:hypothetical protein
MPAPGSGASFYAQADFDGRFKTFPTLMPPFLRYHDLWQGQETNVVWGHPFVGPANGTAPAPGPHADSRYGNGMYIPANNNYDERIDHPSMYNPYLLRPRAHSTKNPDRGFGVEELRYLNAQFNTPNEFRPPGSPVAYADVVGSELAAMAPNSLGLRYPPGMANPRWLITTLSSDIDLPGSSPWRGAPAMDYAFSIPQQQWTNGNYPVGSTNQALSPTATPPASAPAGGDHDAGYRALMTQLGPVDVNRRLADPRQFLNQPFGANNYNPANGAQALRDRQALARDIFARLLFATTGTQISNMNPASADAYRYLAQLAVNIVDYIDEDDYMTPFQWRNSAGGAAPADAQGEGQPAGDADWVFGFERPRLVINEVYGRVENDPMDQDLLNPPMGMPRASTHFIAKWWVELHNPLTPANANELGALSDGGAALLRHPTTQQPIYQLVFARKTPAQNRLTSPPAQSATGNPPPAPHDNPLGRLQNGAGDELYKLRFGAGGMGITQTHDRVGPNLRDANGQGYSSQQPANGGNPAPAFFLVASENEPPDDTPMGQMIANWSDTNLKYNVDLYDVRNPAMQPGQNVQDQIAPRILLRRLANPHEPPGQMNPYVTVDYFRFDRRMMNDAVEYDQMGMPPNPPGMGMKQGQFMQKINWNNHFSYGKRQPFEAPDFVEDTGDLTPYKAAPNPAPAVQEQIRQTFSRHNGQGTQWNTAGNTLEQPFQPLIHQDRVILNPTELLHVVAVKPYEFTQYFKKPATPNDRWAFTANWLDQFTPPNPNQSTFLWRALDFLRTSPPLDGLAVGTRVPGRININTIFAPEILEAIIDPPTPSGPVDYRFAGNRFTLADAQAAWQNLFVGPMGRTPTMRIDGNNRPFRGSAAPGDTAGPLMGRDKTVFKIPQAGQAGLWNSQAREDFVQGGQAGSLQKFELLSKTFGQFTTRSNVFAVYMTVGFFEVMNDGPYTEVNRPVLGKELGSDDGSVNRFKFFTVIDRTNLAIEQELPPPGGPPPANVPPIKQGQMPVYLDYHPALPRTVPVGTDFAVVNDPDLSVPPPNGGPYPPPWVAPEPNTSPVPFQVPGITIRIPALSQVPFNPPPAPPPTPTLSVSGIYDGQLWTLVDGSLIDLDINGQSERVIVRLPPNAFDPITQTAEIVIRPIVPPVPTYNPLYPNFKSNHYRGAAMRLVFPDPTKVSPVSGQPYASIPGNPGPQAGFSYSSPRYAPIVRYAERLR